MTEIEWRVHDDRDAQAHMVAADVGEEIAGALARRGRALVGLSGGSSPFPIYERLRKMRLDWGRVTLFPVDDRLVGTDDRLSNLAGLRKVFAPTDANLLPLFDRSDDLDRAARTANGRLQSLTWPPDIVWLGMGADGHFASIFPGPDLEKALHPGTGNRAVAVRPDPLPADVPIARISLTAPAIAEARRLILTITGPDKRIALDQAISQGANSPKPIGRFLASLTAPITIYWAKA
ncbi:MAG: 6-phosphogluconolactonase [Pseudomonadota bacterium]